MLKLKSGIHGIWPDFSLEIPQEFEFNCGKSYHLRGDNGSGKSSFITQLLLPEAQKLHKQIYLIYLQQLFQQQCYTIKAHAAMHKSVLRLQSEADCLQYLLDNLDEALNCQARPIYIVADESHYLSLIYAHLLQLHSPFCLIFCEHGDIPLGLACNIITFMAIDSNLSRVSESTD